MKGSTAEKLDRIQSLFDEGKSHAEIAKELGYSKMESYYRYIYRYNKELNYNKQYTRSNLSLVKSSGENNEETSSNQYSKVNVTAYGRTGKAGAIIALIESGIDVKEAAIMNNFKDMQGLADYMKTCGYVWNTTKRNYVKKESDQQKKTELNSPSYEKTEAVLENKMKSSLNKSDNCSCGRFEQYNDILSILESRKDKLYELLYGENQSKLTRYRIHGVIKTKSVNMSNSLETVINNFCDEMNITLKEAFEIAIVDFLKKYGYEDKVNVLLKT